MTVKHASVTVSTTAVAVVARTVMLTNEGSETVFVGGSGVTTSAYGAKIAAAGTLTLDLGSREQIYLICATGPVTVRALHLRS